MPTIGDVRQHVNLCVPDSDVVWVTVIYCVILIYYIPNAVYCFGATSSYTVAAARFRHVVQTNDTPTHFAHSALKGTPPLPSSALVRTVEGMTLLPRAQCRAPAGGSHLLQVGRSPRGLSNRVASSAARGVFTATSAQLGKLMLFRRALLIAVAQVPLVGVSMALASTENVTAIEEELGADE